jgi:hypothetical protein
MATDKSNVTDLLVILRLIIYYYEINIWHALSFLSG